MSEKPQIPPDCVILSLEDGMVWASWPGNAERVNLGPEEAVTYMMRDFLAQNEVAKRLNPPEVE